MRVGSSEHWSEVLHKLTGETELNAKALLEYYEPLFDFLSNNMDLYIKATTDREDPVSQTVPIVVGAILGSVVICVLVAYFVKQYRDKKKEDSVVETLADRSP
jgi:ABC-type long-subunit fatty acid transport system fused permease/ATPase subunit